MSKAPAVRRTVTLLGDIDERIKKLRSKMINEMLFDETLSYTMVINMLLDYSLREFLMLNHPQTHKQFDKFWDAYFMSE